MTMTKNRRQMSLVLGANAMHSSLLDFWVTDNHCWKYWNGKCVPEGKLDLQAPSCLNICPDSPNFRGHLVKTFASLSKVKLIHKFHPRARSS
ncbi:Brachyury protein [Sciurus carolinensis]|uniref:Brachyury protein n=1 Tax=Sciurus carolinensis TaxID=30640 RepID=A0AA41NH36_SCICA|nr:Brachyury protein [Sciurus carolinensis]